METGECYKGQPATLVQSVVYDSDLETLQATCSTVAMKVGTWKAGTTTLIKYAHKTHERSSIDNIPYLGYIIYGSSNHKFT